MDLVVAGKLPPAWFDAVCGGRWSPHKLLPVLDRQWAITGEDEQRRRALRQWAVELATTWVGQAETETVDLWSLVSSPDLVAELCEADPREKVCTIPTVSRLVRAWINGDLPASALNDVASFTVVTWPQELLDQAHQHSSIARPSAASPQWQELGRNIAHEVKRRRLAQQIQRDGRWNVPMETLSWLTQGVYSSSREDWEELLRLVPDSPQAWELLAQLWPRGHEPSPLSVAELVVGVTSALEVAPSKTV